MLSEEEIGKLRLTLVTGGWNDVIKPRIQKRAHDAIKALVLTPPERTGEYKNLSDDAIRSRITECEFMLAVWNNEIVVFEGNRRRDELERQNDGANPQ